MSSMVAIMLWFDTYQTFFSLFAVEVTLGPIGRSTDLAVELTSKGLGSTLTIACEYMNRREPPNFFFAPFRPRS